MTAIQLQPRQEWLKARVKTIVNMMSLLEQIESWDEYLLQATDLAKELHYAVTEWEKYYE